MKHHHILLLLAFQQWKPTSGYSSARLSVDTSRSNRRPTSTTLKRTRRRPTQLSDDKKKRKCDICPEPEIDLDMDRREAAFAMLGQILATGTGAASIFASPQEADAVYGADANIAIPNMMEDMNNRINSQCLVESLGNRECLVYLDPAKKIYKGADINVLLERFEKASAALAQIPSLVSEKKWSKVNAVLTGPMGTLGSTMDKLSKLSENEEDLCRLEKIVKNDLYGIAAAAERKNGAQILQLHEKATIDLVSYAEALS